MYAASSIRAAFGALWRTNRFLTGAGLLLLATLVPIAVGLLVDPRTIGGAPAWLKPAKFALSTGVYSLTLVWILSWLPEWHRVRATASLVTGLVFIVEVAIISAQAWRGTTSHFNVGTPLDAVLFSVMGMAIVLQTLAAILVAGALWRQAFEDRAMGWALRIGLTVAIVGASTGGLMTRPTGAQIAALRAGERLTVQGAHTVGAPDGGPGLPITGWSLEHGDLRAAHFMGLHAMQALPLLALVLRRRRIADPVRVRLNAAWTGSYASLFAILLWQALRGQSLVQPDATSMTVMGVWMVASALAFRMARREAGSRKDSGRPSWVSA
jgi:hypothetical protein